MFGPPTAVARLLVRFERPWWIAGGWAVDLFLGRETRPHEDVEAAVLRRDQAALRKALPGWTFEKVAAGPLEPWREGESLDPPIHEVHARGDSAGLTNVEFLLNEAEGGEWRFRRDPRVATPLEKIGNRSLAGVPYLRPEIVLLYKAKSPRDRDEDDFLTLRDALPPRDRAWLRNALATVHPRHPWLSVLRRD